MRLLSDSCGGQNRNRPLNFDKICHGLLVRGHSENESDSIHARIEDASKHVKVYTTSQRATIIGRAKRNKPYYVVKEMVQEEFGDFKYMSKQISDMVKAVDRQSVRLSL